MHVSLVTLGVVDLEGATRFYEALGWRRAAASVDGVVAFLTAGASTLSLFPLPAMEAEVGRHLRRGDAALALAANLPSRDAVDQLVEAVREAGGAVVREPEPTDWGGYGGYVADLDGHLWEVAHNPGFTLLADGRVLPDGDGEG